MDWKNQYYKSVQLPKELTDVTCSVPESQWHFLIERKKIHSESQAHKETNQF